MNPYIYASTVLFLFLSSIWQSGDWKNAFFKTVLFFMGISGVVLSLTALGYMVRIVK